MLQIAFNAPFEFFVAMWTFKQTLSRIREFYALVTMRAGDNNHVRIYQLPQNKG